MMRIRRLGVTLAAALLYLGPFLAGLSAAPATLLPVFAALFTLWIVAMRPAVWAKATRGGTPLSLALHLGGLTLIQAALVVFCFVLGRGFVAILEGTPGLPTWLPVAMSLAALPLARAFWSPGLEASDFEAFLDETNAEPDRSAPRH